MNNYYKDLTGPSITKYNNLIEFLLVFKSAIDKGHLFLDYMVYNGLNINFVSYENTTTAEVIAINHDSLIHIPTLPQFRSYWASVMVKWIKDNGDALERVAKLKVFI